MDNILVDKNGSQAGRDKLDSKFRQKLRKIIDDTAPVSGEYYFQSLVRQLAEALQYRYAVIGKIQPSNMIETVAFCEKGEIVKNMTYSATGTPCANVIDGKLCLYPDDVISRFPDDKVLVDMGVEGYLGVPLLNPQTGKAVGLLTVMHDKPILDSTSIFAILKIFAGRAEAEFERLRSERNLRQILNSIGDGVYGLDREGEITFANPAGARMIGYEVDELIGKKAHRINHHSKPDGSVFPESESLIHAALKDGKVRHESGEVFWRRDGTSFPVEYTSTPIIDGGEVQGAVVAFKNIAERKEYEVKLLESEERLVSILKYSPAVIYLKDLQGRFTLINNKFETLFNLKNEDIRGKTDRDIFPNEFAELFMANDQQVLQSGVPHEFEEVVPQPEGVHTYISNKFPLRDSRGEIYGLCGISLDITGRRRAEEQLKISREQLLHAEKLSAIGKLSASIAHEFNNPIYGIRNVLEIILGEVALSGRQKNFLNLAISECDRVKNLIAKMQDFNRPSNDQVEMFDIHGAIDDMLTLVKQKLKGKGILLEKNYASNITKVSGVSDQIKQVLLNLLKNAEDAIPGDGGNISIFTRARSTQVEIEIRDNGVGIPPENLANIFEPFFTTKPSVKGIGLGLSISYGIIKAHGGSIEVQSTVGVGSLFRVMLPVKQA